MPKIIDLEKVTAVLLADAHWHEVHKGTFKVDGYLNAEDGECVRGKGIYTKHGATWTDVETGQGIACPIGSISAVRYMRRKDDVYED